jgi:hypothetical protein
MTDIPVGTRVIVVEHEDELLLNQTCEVIEVDGSGPSSWLWVGAIEATAKGWVRRSQVSRDNAVDRIGDLYYL